MMIEFQCPACKAPLAVQRSAASGQVDCPRCRELILIPLPPATDSPMGKNTPESREDTIYRFVTPYRNELANKRAQLIEAIEEIKKRNQRIRDLENSGLRVQRDLWSVEAEFEEQRDNFRHLLEEKRNGDSSSPGDAALQSEIHRLTEELVTMKAAGEHSQLAQGRAESLRDELLALQDSHKTLSTRNNQAETELLRLREEVLGLSAGLAERRRIAVIATKLLAAFIEESENAKQGMEGEIRSLKALKTTSEEMDALSRLGADLSQCLTGLQRLAEASQKAKEKGRAQSAQASKIQKKLQADLQAAEDTRIRLSRELLEHTTRNQSLSESLNRTQQQVVEAEKKIVALEAAEKVAREARQAEQTRAEKTRRELETTLIRSKEIQHQLEERETSLAEILKQNEALKKDLASSQADLQKAQDGTASANAKILRQTEEAQQQLQTLQKKIEASARETDRHIASLEQELTQAKDTLRTRTEDIRSARQQLDEQKQKEMQIATRLAETERERDSLRIEYNVLLGATAETTALREELALANTQINTMRTDARRLADELDRKERSSDEMALLHRQLSNRVDHLTSELNDRQVNSEKQDRELLAAQAENRRLTTELIQLREAAGTSPSGQARINDQIRAIREEYEEKFRDLQDRNKSLENRVESDRLISERLMRATDQQRLYVSKIQALENSLREQEATNQRLQQRVQQLSDIQIRADMAEKRNQEYEAQAKRHQDENRNLREAKEAQEREVQKLQDQLTKTQALRQESPLDADKLRTLEIRIRTLETERDHLAKRLAESESPARRSTEDPQALQDLQNRLQETEQLLQKLSSSSANTHLEHVMQELRSSHNRSVALEIQLRDLTGENSRLKSTVKTLTENLKAEWKKRESKSR